MATPNAEAARAPEMGTPDAKYAAWVRVAEATHAPEVGALVPDAGAEAATRGEMHTYIFTEHRRLSSVQGGVISCV